MPKFTQSPVSKSRKKAKIGMASFSTSADLLPLEVSGSTLDPMCWKVTSLVTALTQDPAVPKMLTPTPCASHLKICNLLFNSGH